jgi:protocatechuate 3,4-dioxygenase beta subunit
MGQKLIVPVAFVVLALGACIAIYFLMQGDSPRPGPEPAGNTPVAERPKNESRPLTLADFDVAQVDPDPVRTDRPPQPYVAPKTTMRIVISGRVVDESGVAIVDARVFFTGASRLNGMKGAGYTDAGGNYRLLAWAPNVNKMGDPLGRVAAEAPDGRVAVGENVSIADDALAEMPDLIFAASTTLEGQVITSSGEPAPGAEVTVRSAGPVQVATIQGRESTNTRRQFVTTVIADQSGRYSFKHLPPGRYQVSAEAGYFGVNAQKPEADLTTAGYAWQDVQLENPNQVRGVLKDAAGNSISGAVVRLSMVRGGAGETDGILPGLPAGEITEVRDLRDRTAGFRSGDTSLQTNALADRRALTDAAGRFGFTRLSDADYKLEVKLGDAEGVIEGVKISQPDYALQIEVKTSVAGVVRDAETGLAIEFFDARMAQAASDATPFERVADDGRFEYHPGGGYMIPNPTLEAGMVRISAPGYMPATVSVGDLKEGDARRDLDVTLKPLCELSFDLTRDGRRLDFEPVALLFDDRLAYEASSDQLGRVRIPRVAPATYRVRVTLADGTELQADITVPDARKATLEAKLRTAG